MNTTDPQDELFYLVDKNDNVLGSIPRSQAHRSPDKIHRAIEILIFDKDYQLLIQQRSATKDTDPLCYSLSTGGHVKYGDSYLDSIKREVLEEIGVNLYDYPILELGKLLISDAVEQEINAIFEIRLEYRPQLTILEEEVAGFYWYSLAEVKKMIAEAPDKWTEVARLVISTYF